MGILLTKNNNTWKQDMKAVLKKEMIVIGIDREAIFKLKESDITLTREYLSSYSKELSVVPLDTIRKLCHHLIKTFVEQDPIAKNLLMTSTAYKNDDDAWLTFIFSTSVAVTFLLHNDLDKLVNSYAENN